MKKWLAGIVSLVLLAAGGAYLLRAPLVEVGKAKLTAHMFVSADTDDFDPGLPVGSRFPAILARYQGREITDAGQFIRDKGMIFIANRSVDW